LAVTWQKKIKRKKDKVIDAEACFSRIFHLSLTIDANQYVRKTSLGEKNGRGD